MMPTVARRAKLVLALAVLALGGCSKDAEWPGYGGDGENHFSPLEEVNPQTVGKLGLQWHYDIDTPGTAFTAPVEAGGVLYFASGLSMVHALDAVTGKLLWQYDPKVAEHSGAELRKAWGSRGMTYANGRVFVGTMDGRLIALDAKTGKVAWSVQSTRKDEATYITGAPWVYGNVVVIGFGGGDFGPARGYVTAYDQSSGKQLWRFYTVPGNPAVDKDETTQMAAKTWTGEWWKFGGGGTAWNAMAYDPKYHRIYIGTGNGGPWNRKVRSPGGGDNLFLCSVIALDADTGKYIWHYQINPGETWDYNAAMDMALATVKIDGKPRDVLMTAPKNGFFYVLDRENGKFISAGQIAYQNWNRGFDAAGRPIENPEARYPGGRPFMLFPAVFGAHGPEAMSFSSASGLAYIPTVHAATIFVDPPGGIVNGKAQPNTGFAAVGAPPAGMIPPPAQSGLVAWDPVRQKAVWTLSFKGMSITGGTLATAGGLVFQGLNTGDFNAYDAASGKQLWSFASDTAIRAQPISYSVNGRQYITVIAGGRYLTGQELMKVPDYRTERRRVLTFAIGGKDVLPKDAQPPAPYQAAPGFRVDPALAAAGAATFAGNCSVCHGYAAMSGGAAPHLLRSPVPLDRSSFIAVVRDGGLRSNGMPPFPELTDAQIDGLMHYLRQRAREELATGAAPGPAPR